MSLKKDWNDMSDDDSQEGHHHHHHHIQEQEEQISQQIPSLNKIVSSPLPDKKSPNEQQNLFKLQNSKKQQIWLYIPLYYRDSIQDVDQILRKIQTLKKIQKFSKGWNVLTSKNQARLFITQGRRQGKFFIKFYYSNKNDDDNTNGNKKNDNSYRNNDNNQSRKVKYIPKSPNGKSQIRDFKSPQSLRRIESQQQYISSRSPKTPSYKNQNWKKYQDSRDYKQKNYNKESNKQQDNYENKQKNYKPKYIKKNSNQQYRKGQKQYVTQSPRKKYVQKTQEQPKVQTPSSVKQQQKIQKVQKIQSSEVQEEQTQVTNSPEKKQKKKKNKKNQVVKDKNNPFSMLIGM